jgi:hypothetical protein
LLIITSLPFAFFMVFMAVVFLSGFKRNTQWTIKNGQWPKEISHSSFDFAQDRVQNDIGDSWKFVPFVSTQNRFLACTRNDKTMQNVISIWDAKHRLRNLNQPIDFSQLLRLMLRTRFEMTWY